MDDSGVALRNFAVQREHTPYRASRSCHKNLAEVAGADRLGAAAGAE